MLGVIDSLLTTISSMSEEDKKEALVVTGKLAEEAYNKRTEELKAKTDETNARLEEFVRTYREKINKQQQTENNAE